MVAAVTFEQSKERPPSSTNIVSPLHPFESGIRSMFFKGAVKKGFVRLPPDPAAG